MKIDWQIPSGWTANTDSSDSASIPSGQSRPCLSLNIGSSTNHFVYPKYGYVNGNLSGSAVRMAEGSIEAWIKGGLITSQGSFGLFVWGSGFEQDAFTGYTIAVDYKTGISPVNQFTLKKWLDGVVQDSESIPFSALGFANFAGTSTWKKLHIKFWYRTQTTMVFQVFFDDGTGNGLLNVSPSTPDFYLDDASPLVERATMMVGIYQETSDTDRKIDGVELTMVSTNEPDAVVPTVEILDSDNHTSAPGTVPSGGILVSGTADGINFKTYAGFADVEFKVDTGDWEHLTDSDVNIGDLTDYDEFDEDHMAITWQFLKTGLSLGSHTIYVRATEAIGNITDPVASTSVTVT